jgi:PAP2 superfamily
VSWHLDVTSASIGAAVLMLLALVARPWRRRWSDWLVAAAVETAIVCALFALWQLANGATHGHVAGGLSHGRAVWSLERWLHLPSEASAQRLVLGHHSLVRAINYYYDTAHLTGMLVFLVWLWLRHRDRYRQWRNVVALFTGMSLLVEMVPVAPPRLIGHTGLVDTAMVYGQSVYAFVGSGLADQYAALPSIHVGWAVLIAVAVVRCGRGWGRWLVAVGHGLGTFLIVVLTANHYWLDGVSAVAVLGLAWAAERGLDRLTARWRLPAASAVQIQHGAFS